MNGFDERRYIEEKKSYYIFIIIFLHVDFIVTATQIEFPGK